jgi:hypothetical protein
MERGEDRFWPLRPASRTRRVVAIVLGPFIWLAAFAITSFVVEHTDAIAYGLLIATLSFLASTIGLSVLRWTRQREDRRYADGR